MYTKTGYRSVKEIKRGTVTTAATITGVAGHDIDIVCLTGNMWVNPLITAAQATGIPLIPKESLPIIGTSTLSIISDTSATYMIIVWGE